VPNEQVPRVAPQVPLSQSAFLWQTVVVPYAHVPGVALVPDPHELLSQSAFL